MSNGKRFLLFVGESYDRGCGGWRDYAGSFDSVELAIKETEGKYSIDDFWANITDTVSWEIVKEGDYNRKVPNDPKTATWTWRDE